jgi:hypothetical protein
MFVCFHYSGERLRAIGRDFPGVRIHRRSCILIPPSTYNTGAQVSYLNPGSKVLDVPDWLLDGRQANHGAANPPTKEGEDWVAA